jgi:hypothetical protein
MAYNFLRGDRDQPFLLPPDLRDWLPDGHLAEPFQQQAPRCQGSWPLAEADSSSRLARSLSSSGQCR